MDVDISQTASRITAATQKLYEHAESLAVDGRAKRLWVVDGATATREQMQDDQIRWAFWRLHTPITCRADHESSADYKMWEVLHQCMEAARRDERKRIGASLHRGLMSVLGDEGPALLYDIADAAELLDQN